MRADAVLLRIPLLLASLALMVACAEEEAQAPLVEVIVDVVEQKTYRPKSSFVGRLHAQDDVTIQARVAGYLRSRNFTEGDLVRAGDLLYEIDPAEFDAQVARAVADLAKARANQAVADRNFKRGKELLPDGNISASEMDSLTASRLETNAGVESAKAGVKTAEVNLSYTRILAPITGRIGRSEFSPGDLVGPNNGPLTTLVSIDPIHALFQLSEATLIAAIASRFGEEMRNLNDVDLSDLQVRVELSNRVLFPEVGHIDYFGNRISEDTGTLEARALIPNPRGALVPGQYVRVILQRDTDTQALFVPQSAVQADQQGNFVMAVDNGIVVRRNVVLDERVDEDVVVQQGLSVGETVIVRGLQQVRPGQPVTTRAMPAQDDSPAPPASPSGT
jgi:membrane fusion protein (multidrug efflux system)